MSQKRQLGQTGITLNAIGLGCMGMSEFYGETDDSQSLDVLHHAMTLGVDMLDTADMYGNGHNETLLGQFLKQTTERPFIATKFGIRRDTPAEAGTYQRGIDNSPDYIATACEASLKRLGVETIDLYYMHRYSPSYPLEDAIGAMSRLVEAGKIRAIGLSEVSAETLHRAHAIHPITALQTEYSLQTRDVEAEILPACEALGVSFVAYSPLGRGMLSGAIRSREQLDENDFRRLSPRYEADALEANLQSVTTLETIAKEHGRTPAQIALAWVLQRSERLFAIPGTKRRSYLEANCAAGDIVLRPDDVTRLEDAFAPDRVQGGRYPDAGLKLVNT